MSKDSRYLSRKSIPAKQGATNSPVALLKPIKSQSLDKTVLDSLITMIEQASLKVGDRLPPESELAAQLGVGRSTVREALKAWQSMGIVSRNRGAGTVLAAEVASNSVHVPITLKLEAESLLRTNGVRRPLEVEAIRLACVNASDNQLDGITDNAGTLIGIYADGKDWREADSVFHASIHDACGNPLFGQLSRQIHGVFHSIYEDPFGQPLLGAESIPIHGDLARALAQRDSATAVQCMLDIAQIIDDEVCRHINER